ncbi:transposase [Leptospira interrogans]|uniref:transposase n=1 Tax=Leptospira interrogans TaxID=173 RepID=UPI001F071BB0|nr:transposase [Leptospira interrogans]UML82382.1 transposase [Leptospira interrogans]UML82401.1 transposase [Leptospira interrogans]UML85641.1 transposase [Leptospira interrogans]
MDSVRVFGFPDSKLSTLRVGSTPDQVLNGDIPDKHRFVEQIKEAAAMRPNINKQDLCNPCSDPSTIPKKK